MWPTQPFNIVQNTGPDSGERSVVQLESKGKNRPRVLDITIVEGTPSPTLWFGYADWDWEPATIAGRSGRCADLIDGRRCEVDFGEFTLSIGSGDLVPDELDQMVAAMHFRHRG